MRPDALHEEWTATASPPLTSTITVEAQPYSRPINVIRWGLLAASIALDFGASTQVRMNKRVTVGTDTGRILGAGGTLDLTSANNFASGIAGIFTNVPPGGLQVNPGEQVQFEVVDTADAGNCFFFMQFTPAPFQKTAAHLVPPELPNPDRLANMTRIL